MMRYCITLLLLHIASVSFPQSTLSLQEAIDQALKNNVSLQSSQSEVEVRRHLQKTSFDLPKTNVALLYGQYNSYAKNDNNITVTQSIPFTVFGSHAALSRAQRRSSELKHAVNENEIIYQVKKNFYALVYAKARQRLLLKKDSLYSGFAKSAALRYKTGETNLLEQTTADAQRNEALIQINENSAEIIRLQAQLKTLLNAQTLPDVNGDLKLISVEAIVDSTAYTNHPGLSFVKQNIEVAEKEKGVQSASFAPDLLVGFFSQTLIGTPNIETGGTATSQERFTGVQVGISLPIWFVPHRARVRAAEFTKKAAESNYDYYQQSLRNELEQGIRKLITAQKNLDYFSQDALPNADLILKQSQIAFREGEIGYAEYLLGLRSALNIHEGYLSTLNDFNQTAIAIEYLTGKK